MPFPPTKKNRLRPFFEFSTEDVLSDGGRACLERQGLDGAVDAATEECGVPERWVEGGGWVSCVCRPSSD